MGGVDGREEDAKEEDGVSQDADRTRDFVVHDHGHKSCGIGCETEGAVVVFIVSLCMLAGTIGWIMKGSLHDESKMP